MRRRAGILLCSLLLGFGAAGCMTLPYIFEEKDQPAQTVAWWSLTCEMPNPEKLPVSVRFQWLKGLE